MALPMVQKASSSSLKGLSEDIHARVTPIENVELPPNFGEVVKGIYRSSFPQPNHFSALWTLRLKTIITLVDEPYTPAQQHFVRENNITHHRIIVQAHKDSNTPTPDAVFNNILQILLNPANHPILVHCNKGKHRTGCAIACFRKAQKWGLQDILAEYRRYSYPKSRDLDEQFIFEFDTSSIARLAEEVKVSTWCASDLARSHYRSPSSRFFDAMLMLFLG